MDKNNKTNVFFYNNILHIGRLFFYQKASVALLSPLGLAFYTSWFYLLCYVG